MGKNVKSDLPVMGNVRPLKEKIKELEKRISELEAARNPDVNREVLSIPNYDSQGFCR